MKKIARITEGFRIPEHHSVERILATEEELVGPGTQTRRVYTVVLSDDRYWLTDNDKINHPGA